MGRRGYSLTGAERAIYAMLCAAAEAGAPCPNNAAMIAAVGAKSVSTGARLVDALVARGLIAVSRQAKSRVVTILDTGARTAPTATPASHLPKSDLRDALAELIAEGHSTAGAARQLGISQQRGQQLWTGIKRELGWQAA